MRSVQKDMQDSPTTSPTPTPSIGERLRRNNLYYDKVAKANPAGSSQRRRTYRRALNGFTSRVGRQGIVLDIGCSSGEQLATFQSMGFAALGVEPCLTLNKMATRRGLKVLEGAFETLEAFDIPPVSGIWCAESLIHVPRKVFPQLIRRFYSMLPNRGVFYMSIRLGGAAKWEAFDEDDPDAACFIQYYNEKTVVDLLRSTYFIIDDKWKEEIYTDGSPTLWLSILATK